MGSSQLQATALGLPLILVDTEDGYEASLSRSLSYLKDKHGVEAIVFGSLYLKEDRNWNEQVAYKSGIEPLFPIWFSEDQTSKLLYHFISIGFRSVVCRASIKHFDKTWAGKYLDWNFYEDIHQTNSCVMGELGEYHTFVLDGPIFEKKIEITKSEVVLNSGLWSLDIQACQLVGKSLLE